MLDKHKHKNNNRQKCAHLIQYDEAKANFDRPSQIIQALGYRTVRPFMNIKLVRLKHD